jgi:hypothetical protein
MYEMCIKLACCACCCLLCVLLALLQALQVVVLSGVAVSEVAAARLKRTRPKLQVKATGKKACICQ